MNEINKSLLIGVTTDNELVFIKIETEREYYSITHKTYTDIINKEEGEKQVRETLSDSDYWDNLGMLQKDSFLTGFIDFEAVAEHVIKTDGWQNTKGEYYEIGDYDNTTYYIDFSSCGASIDDLKKDYKKLYITEEEKQLLIKSDSLHLIKIKDFNKEQQQLFNKIITKFEKYESLTVHDAQKTIPILLNEE